MYYFDIAPSRPLMDTLTYSCKEKLAVGTKVEVPLGKTKCYGFVVGEANNNNKALEIKEVLHKVDEHSYFSSKNLEFYKWICDYYHYPLGEALTLITPTTIPKRIKSLDDFTETYVSKPNPLVNLTADQISALEVLRDDPKQKQFSSRNLLYGVTGSGKTEVYIEIIKDTIKKGRGAIVVVPEIALTPQLVKRISEHFAGEISVIHSEISKAEKYKTWMKLASGKSLLCIGARSAIFSPMPDVGLVVVDEEQDSSYKQDDRLRYNGRDLALVIGQLFDAKVILSSATPSVETYYNSKDNKYSYISIDKRVRELCMPSVTMVDLTKAEMVSRNFSSELVNRIKTTLDKKEQVILYINRRGYSNTIMCKSCGERLKCPHCSITLTEHKSKKVMLCHYCGFERDLPNYCTVCNSHDLCSVGSGTERIYEEIEKLFPDAKIARMDSDIINSKKKLFDILDRIMNKKIDIIVGTQILGKGHDFPDVTLVGIINADSTLELPDFRSAEKTFHQITQVSGRAGRASQGEVVVQSYMPEHFAIQCAVTNNKKRFYDEELVNRNEVQYPPFTNLVDIKVSSTDRISSMKTCEKVGELIRDIVRHGAMKITVLGPSPSPIPRINKRYRYHVLLKCKSRSQLNSLLRRFNQEYKRDRKTRVSIDVDPQTLF